MYAWGSARFCRVWGEDSWFYLVTNFPETLKNVPSVKAVATLSLSDEDITPTGIKMVWLLLQKVQRNLDMWPCKTWVRFPRATFNFNKIRRIPFSLMNMYHKYHCHSKHTLSFHFCKFRRGKAIAKYGKGSADSACNNTMACDMFSQGIISDINDVMFMASISWKLAF